MAKFTHGDATGKIVDDYHPVLGPYISASGELVAILTARENVTIESARDDDPGKIVDDYHPVLGPISIPTERENVTIESALDADPTNPDHYQQYAIQPIDFIMLNNLPFWMANVIKYVMREERKNGIEDLKKAKKYIDFRINQLEGKDVTS